MHKYSVVSALHARIFRSSELMSLDTSVFATVSNSTVALVPSSVTLYAPSHSSSMYANQTLPTNTTKNVCQMEYDSWSYDRFWWSPTTQIEYTTLLKDSYWSTLFSTEIYECTQTCGTICVWVFPCPIRHVWDILTYDLPSSMRARSRR